MHGKNNTTKWLSSIYIILFIFSGTISGQNFLKFNNPSKVPGFIGNVEDEFVVVLREEAPPLEIGISPSGIAKTGRENFDAIAGRFQVNRIKKQFSRLKKFESQSPTGKKMARHYKVKFRKGLLSEVMTAYRDHPFVEHVEPIGIHTVYLEANDTYYRDPPNPVFPYDQWHYWDNYGIDADLA